MVVRVRRMDDGPKMRWLSYVDLERRSSESGGTAGDVGSLEVNGAKPAVVGAGWRTTEQNNKRTNFPDFPYPLLFM
ncbi:hypothetical protein RYX36_033073 [Vicia faba]